jgi:hypothetical protein
MSRPSPWMACASYMSRAGIERVVVHLEPRVDVDRDDIEFEPVILARWDYATDRVRHTGPDRLAKLAWDAVEAHWPDDDRPHTAVVENVTTHPGGPIRPAASCGCDPWSGHCKRCDDTGWITDTTRAASA